MLVLTRKLEESLIIGEDIEIKVLEIKGDNVRLGITAPLNVTVYRKEVYERIKEMNVAAQKSRSEKIRIPFRKNEGGDASSHNTKRERLQGGSL